MQKKSWFACTHDITHQNVSLNAIKLIVDHVMGLAARDIDMHSLDASYVLGASRVDRHAR